MTVLRSSSFFATRVSSRSALLWAIGVVAWGCTEPDSSSPASGVESAEGGAPQTASSAPVADPSADAARFESEALPEPDHKDVDLADQRQAMFRRMRAMGVADDEQIASIAAILGTAKWAGQGNPESTVHPLSRSECLQKRADAGVRDEKKPQCGAPFMVPIFNPSKETEAQAKVCIDRYEFPNLPCDYPVTWITTSQAEKVCKVMGKRLCDAHEWEGACAGSVRAPEEEYAFGMPRQVMQGIHNSRRDIRWAYGADKDHKKCGTGSRKSATCTTIGWKECGTNTYPAGAFPECKSPFGVYDQHGNAAEHMALPMKIEDLGSRGGFGQPEMKGSWFIFQQKEAHIDDCRWRAPSWHDNEGKNHANYHLSFRCCKDL